MRRISPWIYVAFLVLFAALCPPPVFAQTNVNLVVYSVWAEPDPLQCPSQVCALIYSAGAGDYAIGSGDVQVRFESESGSGTRSQFALTPITWSPDSLGLLPGQTRKVCAEFSPAFAVSYRFSASLAYPSGVVDTEPGNDSNHSNSYSVTSSCGIGPFLPPCRASFKSGYGVVGDCPWLPPRDVCSRFPALCTGCPIPGACGGVDVCALPGVHQPCPIPGSYDILVGAPPHRPGPVILDGAGKMVASAEPLSSPVKEKGVTYTHRIRFASEAGQRYFLALPPSPAEDAPTNFSVPVLVKQPAPR